MEQTRRGYGAPWVLEATAGIDFGTAHKQTSP